MEGQPGSKGWDGTYLFKGGQEHVRVAGHFHDCPGERRMVRAGLRRPSPSPGLLLSRRCFPGSQPAHGAHPTGDPRPTAAGGSSRRCQGADGLCSSPAGWTPALPACLPWAPPRGSGVITTHGQQGAWNPQPTKPHGRYLWTEPPIPPLTDGVGRSLGLEGVLRGRRHSPSPSSTMAWMTTGNTPRSRSKFS